MPTIVAALIQFDAGAEKVDRNLARMDELVRTAVDRGARWIMFHEGTACDYTPKVDEFAERVPTGKSTSWATRLAKSLRCHISFGLSERENSGRFITQVFVGPEGFIYKYRKTWLWHEPSDAGYRNEWARYDPGSGPELFTIDGIPVTCFICADGDSARCIQRAARLKPQVVFFPNNRSRLPGPEYFAPMARTIGAHMLVTNRVGPSWDHGCQGGCAVYSPTGDVLAIANTEGREEILVYPLQLP